MDINETNFSLTDEQSLYELYNDIVESPDYLAACKCGSGWYNCGYLRCCKRMGGQTAIQMC